MKKAIQRIGIVLLVLILAVAVIGAIWVNTPYAPDAEALAAYDRAEKTEEWYAFPAATDAHAANGFIIYPGGLVDFRAYAVIAEQLAQQGDVLVIVLKVPLNLAITNPDKADAVEAAYPDVQNWYVGGHSLGGVAAAIYADTHRESVQGVFLWASVPPDSNSLADDTLPVVTLRGSEDQVFSSEDYLASKPLLPADASWVTVEGGNHSYFGNYGLQRGDGIPRIDRQTAQNAIVAATLTLQDK